MSAGIKYADVWVMQSVIYKLSGNEEGANNSRAAALEVKEAGAQCLEFLKGKKLPSLEIALPFQHFKRENNCLLTSGSLRLTKFFREQIYNSIA